jgi:thioredoxin 1
MSIELDPSKFESEVIQSSIPVVVDFGATWCGPCKALAPQIDKLAAAYGGKAKVFGMDVDKANALATKYGIRSVPTVIFFKNGAESARIVGLVPYEQIEKKLAAIL